MSSTSTKPYLVRALYEWCGDNAYTPHLVVWVNQHTRVPRQYVQNEQIVLNIGMNAVKELFIDNEWIRFNARFDGVAQEIWVPMGHVLGIMARETGEGMGFEVEPWQPESQNAEPQPAPNAEQARPKLKKGLKLVK